jgi:hypothetical protein
MICHICGEEASLFCDKCRLAVCIKHFEVLNAKKFYDFEFMQYDSKNLCAICLEPIKCNKCYNRAIIQCVFCRLYFCNTHGTNQGARQICWECVAAQSKKEKKKEDFKLKTKNLEEKISNIDFEIKKLDRPPISDFEIGNNLIGMPLICLLAGFLLSFLIDIRYYIIALVLYSFWMYIFEIGPRVRRKRGDVELERLSKIQADYRSQIEKVKKEMGVSD